MKPRLRTTATLLALLACAPGPGRDLAAQIPDTAVTAFVGVTVIPMDRERVLERHTVLVRGGRITALGPTDAIAVPAGARVIDGAGRYLLPGLAEMHAHIPAPPAPAEATEHTLFLYLAGGVTTIRGMLGHPAHLELRERATANELLAPRIVTSGPSFNGNSVPDAATARRMAEEQHAAGYDFLKIHPGVPRAAYDTLAATAHRLGIPFAGHVPAEVGLRRALAARQATIDHLDGYAELLVRDGHTFDAGETGLFGFNLAAALDSTKIAALAAATRDAGVWNVPTETLMEHLASPEAPEAMAQRPEMRYVAPATLERWIQAKRDFQQQPAYSPEAAAKYLAVRRALIRGLHRAGAGLLLGSDAPQWWNVPGFSVQRELALLVGAGLTPYQALETGTRNPAVFFGAEQEFGTVAEGRSADLLLLDADPLADIAHVRRIAGVMVRGRWLGADEIRQRLDAIAEAVR